MTLIKMDRFNFQAPLRCTFSHLEKYLLFTRKKVNSLSKIFSNFESINLFQKSSILQRNELGRIKVFFFLLSFKIRFCRKILAKKRKSTLILNYGDQQVVAQTLKRLNFQSNSVLTKHISNVESRE
jgi:hypothetical protein